MKHLHNLKNLWDPLSKLGVTVKVKSFDGTSVSDSLWKGGYIERCYTVYIVYLCGAEGAEGERGILRLKLLFPSRSMNILTDKLGRIQTICE
jgi:hypothetical protein